MTTLLGDPPIYDSLMGYASQHTTAQQSTEKAKQEIRKVVASYFNSFDHKDSVTFCNLFALDSVSFFGVNAPETYQAYLKKKSQCPAYV